MQKYPGAFTLLGFSLSHYLLFPDFWDNLTFVRFGGYTIIIASPIATVTYLNRTFVIGNCIYNTPNCASSQSYIRKFLHSVPPQSFIRCFTQAFSLLPDQPGNLMHRTFEISSYFRIRGTLCHLSVMHLRI